MPSLPQSLIATLVVLRESSLLSQKRDWENNPPAIQEEIVSDLLHHIDIHKSMGPDGLHLRVLKELAGMLTKPLSIIYQQSWLTGEVPTY